MAKTQNLLSENATIKTKLDANIIKGVSYEGLPLATDINSGTVMIDNITIKNNNKGQLYCTVADGNGSYDDSAIVNHMQNKNLHLSEIQNSTISSVATHIADTDKHLNESERATVNKINTHISDINVHIDQEKITNIELSINHTKDSTKHLSVSDRDNLNNLSTHIDNSDVHVTQTDKNKIVNMENHTNNNNIHLSEEDRENITTTLSVASTFPNHLSNNNIHFDPYEKERILKKISDNEILINDLSTLGDAINNMALSKLDSGNHEINKMLITDDTGNIVYSNIPSNNGGDANTLSGKKVFIQQSTPTATQVGDVWISW